MQRFGLPYILFVAVMTAQLVDSRLSELHNEAASNSAVIHPIVGAWIVTMADSDPSAVPVLMTFGLDGSVLVTETKGPNTATRTITGHGRWIRTADRAATFAYVYPQTDENGVFSGFLTYTASAEVDRNDVAWSRSSLSGELSREDGSSYSGVLLPSSDLQLEAVRIEVGGGPTAMPGRQPARGQESPGTPTP